MAEAHELGLVLGDIKPSSILLTDGAEPSLAVYGMATRRFDDGRPSYGAPEVKPGASLTSAADVYSLCLTLAALIAGRSPNRGRPAADFLAAVADVAPAWLLDVVTTGLSISPDERYRDARVLAAALGTGLTAETESPDAAPPSGLTLDLDDLLGDADLATGAGNGDLVLSGLGGSGNVHDADPSDPFDFEALLELPTAPAPDPGRRSIGVDEFLDLDDILGVTESIAESDQATPQTPPTDDQADEATPTDADTGEAPPTPDDGIAPGAAGATAGTDQATTEGTPADDLADQATTETAAADDLADADAQAPDANVAAEDTDAEALVADDVAGAGSTEAPDTDAEALVADD
ncbi:MAG: hypothetical protein AAGK32_10295, partial [Actinomycetota bacterium]